jgi:lipopolysaccharide transport system ATP-binding protein
VLAVGDAGFQKKCLGKMKEVGRSGRTVLFVSHNMNAVEQLCERAMLLEHGQVKRFDSDVRAVINEHLFGEHNELQASEWAATDERFRNPFFSPVRFAITDAAGHPLDMPASNDADMFVTLEGDIEQLDPALTVGYAIYSEDGHLLFWSYQSDRPEENWPKLTIGRNKLVGRIPSRLLNEGTYRVELIGGLHFRSWLFEPGMTAPTIFLTIQGGLSESPYWLAKRPGMLAPVLEWRNR